MQTKVDESGWLNEIWAEGGAVLDIDRKKLLFYGGEDIRYDVPLRDLHLACMRSVWQGWEIDWAHEGIADLASYVGVAKETVLKEKKAGAPDTSLAPPEERTWVDTAASVKFPDDELLVFPLSDGIKPYLFAGPAMVDKIDRAHGYRALALREWTENFPTGGFHLDIGAKSLAFWHADDLPNIAEQIRRAWPSWTIVNHFDRYAAHAALTNGKLQFQAIEPSRLAGNVRSLLLGDASNPVDALAEFIKTKADEGSTIAINPNALKHDRHELPRYVKESIVNAALASL
ncbi:hypothetical protein [Paenibacillus glycinis]|uniref:Uncharacterized protein n=1 Tax=Paenibacillus glycinis TaxID=2697035 RepID=A0ABW9XTJ6_9BACL|nr:hypothetical protein [Paenibacillus glycinis]NBD25661.1 hypothetical protein [Paenibacillus glycinis]